MKTHALGKIIGGVSICLMVYSPQKSAQGVWTFIVVMVYIGITTSQMRHEAHQAWIQRWMKSFATVSPVVPHILMRAFSVPWKADWQTSVPFATESTTGAAFELEVNDKEVLGALQAAIICVHDQNPGMLCGTITSDFAHLIPYIYTHYHNMILVW